MENIKFTIDFDYYELQYLLLALKMAIDEKDNHKELNKKFMCLVEYLENIGLIGGEE